MTTRVTMDCIACGRCVEICPEVFEMGEEIAHAKNSIVDPEYQEAVREAAEECPTNAIVIEE
jgi:ferredoxin